MHIIADKHIPEVTQAFSSIGHVTLVDGRSLQAAQLRDADMLLVRSVTRVDAGLLQNSPVRIVGSATSGIDHIDCAWLHSRNIRFLQASGANARAVAEYVVAALCELSRRDNRPLQGLTLGIIGYGHVGSTLAPLARILGMRVLINDPPLQERHQRRDVSFCALDDLLPEADVISLHVPLTRDGRHPTWRMVNDSVVQRLRDGAWLINTSRGAIADSDALLQFMRRDGTAVLDVWPGEPQIAGELLQLAALATPHIAGYSRQAKLNATAMLYDAICRELGITPAWTAPSPAVPPLQPAGDEMAVFDTIRQVYDIRQDDRRLRSLLLLPLPERAGRFDRLRAEYDLRNEFSAWHCDMSRLTGSQREVLLGLGLRPQPA